MFVSNFCPHYTTNLQITSLHVSKYTGLKMRILMFWPLRLKSIFAFQVHVGCWVFTHPLDSFSGLYLIHIRWKSTISENYFYTLSLYMANKKVPKIVNFLRNSKQWRNENSSTLKTGWGHFESFKMIKIECWTTQIIKSWYHETKLLSNFEIHGGIVILTSSNLVAVFSNKFNQN